MEFISLWGVCFIIIERKVVILNYLLKNTHYLVKLNNYMTIYMGAEHFYSNRKQDNLKSKQFTSCHPHCALSIPAVFLELNLTLVKHPSFFLKVYINVIYLYIFSLLVK
jgi:hypothetical protein